MISRNEKPKNQKQKKLLKQEITTRVKHMI